jgi:hypothetical protein
LKAVVPGSALSQGDSGDSYGFAPDCDLAPNETGELGLRFSLVPIDALAALVTLLRLD